MIYCYNCGKQTNNNARFCPKCGIELFHGTDPGVMGERIQTRTPLRKRALFVLGFLIIVAAIILLLPFGLAMLLGR